MLVYGKGLVRRVHLENLLFLAFPGQLRGMTREWSGKVEGNLRYVVPQCKVRGAVLRNKCLGSMCFVRGDGTGVLWPWTWKGVEWKGYTA